MKTTFAFLTHPVHTQQVKIFWPLTRIMPQPLIRPFLKNQTLKAIPMKKVRDRRGHETSGVLLITPIHPDDLLDTDEEILLEKIVSAGRLAQRMGFKILGLGGYFASLADRKPMLYKHMKVPVTTGAAFTAWTAYEAAFKAARKNKLNLSQATVTLLSPVNSIGELCGRQFAGQVARMILAGDKEERLDKVRTVIQGASLVDVTIENDLTKAVDAADIIVNADPLHSLFDLDRIGKGKIICDVSIYGGLEERAKRRPDITAVDCSLVSTPTRMRFCPTIAETAMLSLEQNFVNYSLGENVNPNKMDYIANLASRCGFEVKVPGAEIA
ncbi:MAG: hypothetical protein ACM3OC_02480 [Deltaproteobacteria bacterium]